MVMQRRRNPPRKGAGLTVWVTTVVVPVCCGVVLWSAGSAQATLTGNGINLNGWANGLTVNGLPTSEAVTIEGPREGLPFTVISQKALGTTYPERLTRSSLGARVHPVPRASDPTLVRDPVPEAC